ncbi:Hypothetical protein CINCED_3A022085 [Cinara cedri]|uniref:Glycolipid transfer protein domain-containing protein n=1 Tax=Cinara cedri TaxID=506608 RepID=A0A5E4NA75_9HEMI|nr:Hypothetical protein CINCED_3A022085 [Cinara cedri]
MLNCVTVLLDRFCSQLGTLFGFVVNDIQEKIGRLNDLMDQDEPHYSTVQSMILFEKCNATLMDNSGCITLLRLHRGLEFIILFMSKLIDLQPTESTTYIAQGAYSQTLAKHHSFWIRHGAYLAMNFLPCQKNLYLQTVGDENIKETLNAMPDMIAKATEVHNRLNTLFLDFEILNLP